MPETFTEYLAKYSSKTRRKLKRAVRLLAREGRVEVIRVTAAEEVDAFVDAAERVSRTSYQYNLLGLGIQDPQREKRQLGFWARQGWLRSYLLKIDDRPVAYMFGLQDARTFYYWDVAHDPEWNRLSPGKVLQYHVFEVVFAHRRPEVFDFSTGHGEHKQFFENDCFFGADVFLVPRRVYPSLVLHAHLATRRATDKVSELLDRFNLKHRVRRAIRQASVVLRGRRQ